MPLFISSLNSGSNGNCYYVGTPAGAILIDAGLSCLETEKRMIRLGLSLPGIRAIFISHEHSDHIFGLASIVKKYRIPVYITESTLKGSKLRLDAACVHLFKSFDPIIIGDLTILPFPKIHDASDPHSFVVSGHGVNVGVFTDIGRACEEVTRQFSSCHAAFLEANFDEALLEAGRYPWFLKNRIRGGQGHLSNSQALALYLSHRAPFLRHLILSHLSRENNSPERVAALFSGHAADISIVVASRVVETPIFQVNAVITSTKYNPLVKKRLMTVNSAQLSLF